MLTVEGKPFSATEVALLRSLIARLTNVSDGPAEVSDKLAISPFVAAAVMGQMPPPPAEIQIPIEVVAAPEAPPVVRKGGRPKGSKNKPKDANPAPTPVADEAPKSKGGRPKGSKNKPKETPAAQPVAAAPVAPKPPPRITKFDADTIEVLKKRVAAGDTYESLAARLDVPVSLIISSLLD
jgi:hypothetical protein